MREAWHRTIEDQPAVIRDAFFCATAYKPIEDANAKMRYLSAKEGNRYGLPEGLYVETDVDSEQFSSHLAARIAIQILDDLTIEPKKLPGILSCFEDATRIITFAPCETTIDGGQIIRFRSYLPDGFTPEVDDFLKGKTGGCNIPGADLREWSKNTRSH